MKPSIRKPIPSQLPVLGSALVLAVATSVYAQDKAPGALPSASPMPSAKPATSSGLLNDWLRGESDAFKAWDLGGQVRARFEYFNHGPSFEFPARDFQKTGVDNENSYLLLREKLHLGYTPAPWVGFYVEARDSSSSGDDHSKNPGADALDLHQAYVSLGDAKEFPLTAKVGRQELIYGDERLVGVADWTNTGRVFDAAKLRLGNPDSWVDVFTGRPVLVDNHNFNMPNDYDWLTGVYGSTKALVSFQETQLYFLSRNTSAQSPNANEGGVPESGGPSARDIYTVGLRLKSLPAQLGNWDYTAELVGQFGSVNSSGQRLTQEAYAAALAAGYTWKQAWASPRVAVEYSFSTGDSDPTDGKSQVLDNLFPTNHKYYGYMDFVGWRNIHNPRLMIAAKPAKALAVSLDYHLFWLADTRDFFYPQAGSGRIGLGYGRNANYDSFVGSELDLEATYSFVSWGAVRVGYGHFFAGDYVRQSKASVGGAADADWAYAQLTLNF